VPVLYGDGTALYADRVYMLILRRKVKVVVKNGVGSEMGRKKASLKRAIHAKYGLSSVLRRLKWRKYVI